MTRGLYHQALKRDLLFREPNLPCCREAFLAAMILRTRAGPRFRLPRGVGSDQLPAWLSRELGLPRELGLSRIAAPSRDDGKLRELRRRVRRRLSAELSDQATGHCHRAFLQGLFVRAGYMQDPRKTYHLEIRLRGRWMKAAFRKSTRVIRVRFASCERRGETVAYLKGRKRLLRFLQALELFEPAQELSDFTATRDLLGVVNRQVNAETANINRQVAASGQMVELIDELLAWPDQSIWSDALYQMALLRRKFPQDSLEILGKRFRTPLSKSAVNHRLRRIAQLHKRLTNQT